MAYALAFPKDVTDLLYSMRDWRLEQVRAEGGTPVARMLHAHVTIERDPPPATFTFQGGVIHDQSEWLTELMQQEGDRPCIRFWEAVPGFTYGYRILLDEPYTFHPERSQGALEGFHGPRRRSRGGASSNSSSP